MTALRLDEEKCSSHGQSSSSLDSSLSTDKLSTSSNRYSSIAESSPGRNYFDLANYQSSVLQLACAYQSILKNYANIEQEALNYRASAKKVTRERQSGQLPSEHKTIPSPCKLPLTQNSFISSEQNIFQPTSRTANKLSSYVLPVEYVGPSRVLLDQITSYGLHFLKYQPNPIVGRLSSKVFLGGVPVIAQQVTTVTRDQLQRGLEMFGTVTLIWPKGITVKPSSGFHNPNCSALELKRGHCYATFKDPISVALLLTACQRRNKGYYINLASVCPELKLSRLESLQVIPWDRNDSEVHVVREADGKNNNNNNCENNECQPRPLRSREMVVGVGLSSRRKKQYSVFVGALHGLITARALFSICDDLFGNVNCVIVDTDRYHYPIGSGRVAFSSPKSYLDAVNTNFVHVKCQFFQKTIQIDPYLEDSLCCKCVTSPGVYFCRDLKCFDYFCPACWIRSHTMCTTHKPIRRTVNSKTGSLFLR